MLDIARERVPAATSELGDLTRLPVDDGTFDFAICALALAHLRDPAPAIAELARAVRPGGRIVLTDAHPTFVLIQGQAMFPTDGGMAFVRNYPHPARDLPRRVPRRAGLTVLECLEAPIASDFTTGMFAEASDAAQRRSGTTSPPCWSGRSRKPRSRAAQPARLGALTAPAAKARQSGE